MNEERRAERQEQRNKGRNIPQAKAYPFVPLPTGRKENKKRKESENIK